MTSIEVTRTEVSFESSGTRCTAWYFRSPVDDVNRPAGRPIVVMAHGLGGTKDSGLQAFAEPIARAGLDVFVFDYRGFGGSDGTPRQTVSIDGQIEDYRAAMAAATELPGVDPNQLVLWGVSLSGGHVFTAAAGRDDVCAVVSLTPLVNGAAAGRLAFAHHPVSAIAKSAAAGVRSRLAGKRGRPGRMMPIVGSPGEVAALALEGCYADYMAIAGPTWRNEIDASIGLELGGLRADRSAGQLRCPVLVQVADFDRSAPPHAAEKAAFDARAEVRHYPCDHFGVWPGQDWFDAVVTHQMSFLRRHLGMATPQPVPARPVVTGADADR
jgi:pimeloyl-ACP methyl ester carboxylesterase